MKELQVLRETVVLDKPFKIYGDEENPVFLAKDVAEWIGHSDVSMMVKGIDEDEKLVQALFVSGQRRDSLFLTVNGMYEVLFQSRLPLAKEFKKQVKAVLEEIRKTGSYGILLTNPPSDTRLREVNKAVRMGVLSAKEGKSVLLTPAAISDRLSVQVREKRVSPVQTATLPAIPALDTFLSLPDFSGWREKLDENMVCFERIGVKLIRRGTRKELAIDHNHKILLRAAGRDYKARLKTDPRYIETRQVYIAHEQVSALIFDWNEIYSH